MISGAKKGDKTDEDMLETLRKSAGGWVAKIFLGLLVLAFAIWGIGDVFRGFGQQDLAQIGSVKITIDSFRSIYNERVQQLSRQFRRAITPEQARALALDRQILGELISETALDEKARRLGLGLDNETLLKRIQENQLFRGPGGRFDPRLFAEILRDNGYTEARYVDSERRLMLRQQISRALTGDIAPPPLLREAVRRFENEERAIEFVTLARKDAGAIPAPTEEQLASYFESHKATFRAPEYRKLTVLALAPETIASGLTVSDAELRKAFESQRERLAIPERREVEQIVFPNMDEAKAAAQRLAAGEKFETIVKERGLAANDVSLGLVAKRDILDRGVADAIFALPVGRASEPVAGRFGAVLVRVNKIAPGKDPVFAEAAEGLRKEFALEQAKRRVLDLHDKVEDERASGANLSEVAKKLGLAAISVEAVDRSGRNPDGKAIEGLPQRERLIEGAFNSQIGVETDPIEDRASGGYVWYDVTGITPSRERTLAEARERVEARWRDEEIAKRLSERAEAIRARLDTGEKFPGAASGLRLEAREKLKRNSPVEGIDGRALAQVFRTDQGKAGIAVGANGIDRIVFRVTAANSPPESGMTSQTVARLGAGLQEDLLVQYVTRLQSDLGVWVNEGALRNVTGAEPGS
jgi:peptidyl-prolyl cis-trans isomerase D